MFSKVRDLNYWSFSADSPAGITPLACIELELPIIFWRSLFTKPDGINRGLGSKVETWEFKYDLQEGEYALGAIYEGETRPVVFLTSPALYTDFVEFLKEGVDLIMPAYSMD